MGVNSLPKTVTRQRRGWDLNPGPSAPESSTLATRLPPEIVVINRNKSPLLMKEGIDETGARRWKLDGFSCRRVHRDEIVYHQYHRYHRRLSQQHCVSSQSPSSSLSHHHNISRSAPILTRYAFEHISPALHMHNFITR